MKSGKFLEINKDDFQGMLKVYDRTEESLLEDVTRIKEWMKTQPHLPEILDDKSIQNFLILNKCSIEKTKQKIDAYYTIRSLMPDMYEDINPKLPNMREQMEIVYFTPLPKRTQEMCRIMFFKIRNKEMVDIMQPHNVYGHANNLQELRLKEDTMFRDVLIYDMQGVNLAYFTKITPSLLAKGVAIYEKVFTIPVKAVYLINSPPFISTVLTIIKTLIKPKLFQRIHVCEDTSILNEKFPKELLPKDYGGEQESLEELQEWLKLKFNDYEARFDQLDQLRVNESLRPKKLENDEILGFYGNFKKLNVD